MIFNPMYPEYRKDLKLLEIEEGASLSELKTAYRELTKVWHPDRFENDPKLAVKASRKLTEINAAYKRLESYLSSRTNQHQDPPKNDQIKESHSSSNPKSQRKYIGDNPSHRIFQILFSVSVVAIIFFLSVLVISIFKDIGFGERDFEETKSYLVASCFYPLATVSIYNGLIYVLFGNRVACSFRVYWKISLAFLLLALIFIMILF